MRTLFLALILGLVISGPVQAKYPPLKNKGYGGEVKAYGGNAYQNQKQGQIQGQLQGQLSKQGNEQSFSNHEGDTEVTTAVWPTTPSTTGKEEKSIYSLFGGVGSNNTEEHLRLEHELNILRSAKEQVLLDEESYKARSLAILEQIASANEEPKLLGGLFMIHKIPFLKHAGRGCNVINICGLAAW